ncbi:MAG: DNA-3-methyladenine glycosylase [Armatimonadetes bacterium]|nr:DNA-3-methyladenine glycosylase [Armatimonadota bacterium]
MTRETRRILGLSALEAAPRLLGMVLRVDSTAGLIVETEAYSEEDPASHSHGGERARNRHMYLAGGHFYVYRSYGIHWCLNLVIGPERSGQAVLIRALEPLDGIELMKERRGMTELRRLCAGPANVAKALGVSGEHSGLRLGKGGLDLLAGPKPRDIHVGPRIGITRAVDWPRRFLIPGSKFLSRPPKRVSKK